MTKKSNHFRKNWGQPGVLNPPETLQATRNPHLHDTLTHPLGGSELCGSTAGCSCRSQTLNQINPKFSLANSFLVFMKGKCLILLTVESPHSPSMYRVTYHSSHCGNCSHPLPPHRHKPNNFTRPLIPKFCPT